MTCLSSPGGGGSDARGWEHREGWGWARLPGEGGTDTLSEGSQSGTAGGGDLLLCAEESGDTVASSIRVSGHSITFKTNSSLGSWKGSALRKEITQVHVCARLGCGWGACRDREEAPPSELDCRPVASGVPKERTVRASLLLANHQPPPGGVRVPLTVSPGWILPEPPGTGFCLSLSRF